MDTKISSNSHINSIRSKFRKQFGIVSKMCYYVPKTVMIDYYGFNIKPILQNRICVYDCTSYIILYPFLIQQKIIPLIFFKRKFESIRQVFDDEKFLPVHELHVYEFLNFFVQPIAEQHSETFLNELFVFDKPLYMIRRSTFNLIKIPNFKSKIQRTSIIYRGAKLFNIIRQNSLNRQIFDQVSHSDIQRIAHEIRSLFKLSNEELIKFVFFFLKFFWMQR